MDLGLAQYKLYVSKGEETKKGCEHDCKLSHAEHRHLKSFAEKRKQEPFPPLANNDFKSAKALFGCNYEVGPRTDPKRLEKAITDLLDVRSNKKTKNARLSLEGNWTEETGFEKGVDLKVLRQLLTRWEAQSRLLDEPWPFKDNELCMENLWRAHRAETDVVELLLKRNSPLEKLTQDQVSVWWPIVGEKTANVTFKPAHKRHKDLKVLLCNFPTQLQTLNGRKKAVVNGFRAKLTEVLNPLVLKKLALALTSVLQELDKEFNTEDGKKNEWLEHAKAQVRG